MKRPAQRRELAAQAVAHHGVSIALACRIFGISETCFRYRPRLAAENDRIADLLVGLTQAHRRWGFGLCFLYLRNVQGQLWNHKRVYRIYRELELNLRIKPRRRLVREKPEKLSVPALPNRVWSMDFMADRLMDGRAFRLLNILDDLCGRPVRCNGSHLLSLCVSLNLVFSVECIAARRMRGSGQVRPYVRPVCATFFAGHYGCALACQAPILKTCSMAHVIQRYRLNCS